MLKKCESSCEYTVRRSECVRFEFLQLCPNNRTSGRFGRKLQPFQLTPSWFGASAAGPWVPTSSTTPVGCPLPQLFFMMLLHMNVADGRRGRDTGTAAAPACRTHLPPPLHHRGGDLPAWGCGWSGRLGQPRALKYFSPDLAAPPRRHRCPAGSRLHPRPYLRRRYSSLHDRCFFPSPHPPLFAEHLPPAAVLCLLCPRRSLKCSGPAVW